MSKTTMTLPAPTKTTTIRRTTRGSNPKTAETGALFTVEPTVQVKTRAKATPGTAHAAPQKAAVTIPQTASKKQSAKALSAAKVPVQEPLPATKRIPTPKVKPAAPQAAKTAAPKSKAVKAVTAPVAKTKTVQAAAKKAKTAVATAAPSAKVKASAKPLAVKTPVAKAPVAKATAVTTESRKKVAVQVKKAAPAPTPVRITETSLLPGGSLWRMTGRHGVAYVTSSLLAGELLATDAKNVSKQAMAVYYDRKGRAVAWQVRFDTERWEEIAGRLG